MSATAGGFGQLLGASPPTTCLICEGECAHTHDLDLTPVFTPKKVDLMAELHEVQRNVWLTDDGKPQDGTKDGYLAYGVGDRIPVAEARKHGLLKEAGPLPVAAAPEEVRKAAAPENRKGKAADNR